MSASKLDESLSDTSSLVTSGTVEYKNNAESSSIITVSQSSSHSTTVPSGVDKPNDAPYLSSSFISNSHEHNSDVELVKSAFNNFSHPLSANFGGTLLYPSNLYSEDQDKPSEDTFVQNKHRQEVEVPSSFSEGPTIMANSNQDKGFRTHYQYPPLHFASLRQNTSHVDLSTNPFPQNGLEQSRLNHQGMNHTSRESNAPADSNYRDMMFSLPLQIPPGSPVDHDSFLNESARLSGNNQIPFSPGETSTSNSTGIESPFRNKRQTKVKAPPRPPNQFILYRKDKHAEIVARDGRALANNEISKLVGEMWRTESPEVKAQYAVRALAAKNDHRAAYPNYKYQPRKNKPKRSKRDKDKDDMDKIKSPLEGNDGGDNEFTPTNFPQRPVTRILPPITAVGERHETRNDFIPFHNSHLDFHWGEYPGTNSSSHLRQQQQQQYPSSQNLLRSTPSTGQYGTMYPQYRANPLHQTIMDSSPFANVNAPFYAPHQISSQPLNIPHQHAHSLSSNIDNRNNNANTVSSYESTGPPQLPGIFRNDHSLNPHSSMGGSNNRSQ